MYLKEFYFFLNDFCGICFNRVYRVLEIKLENVIM